MVTLISHSPDETQQIGEAWGREAQPGWVIGLTGELGAGKTQLAKGVARGLGFLGRVHSPTFALLHEYRGGRCPLWHVDLHRLDTPEQVIAAGLEEFLGWPAGIVVVEWAERWPAFGRLGDLHNPAAPMSVEGDPLHPSSRGSHAAQTFPGVETGLVSRPHSKPGGSQPEASPLAVSPPPAAAGRCAGKPPLSAGRPPPAGRRLSNARAPVLLRRVLIEVRDDTTRRVSYEDFGA